MRLIRALLLLVLLFLLASPLPPVHAAGWVVNTLSDTADGSCSDDTCSLRDAVALAAPGETITFSVQGTVLLYNTPILVDKKVKIEGPGSALLSISGERTTSHFTVGPNGVLEITGLTITRGVSLLSGGAITNNGNLSLTDCTVRENSSTLYGGAIDNHGKLTVNRCTFSGNSAANGGAIQNTSGSATLTNCTFTQNSAGASGGSIASDQNSQLSLTNCTLVQNNASQGDLASQSTSTFVYNTIIAEQSGIACYGSLNGLSSNNLTTGIECEKGFNINPFSQLRLDRLTGNPAYFPLLKSSPAVDQGSLADCPAVDERGVARPQPGSFGGTPACDIGAFEYQDFTIFQPLIAH